MARRSSRRFHSDVWATFIAALLLPSCLDRREAPKDDARSAPCAECHGDPSRAGDPLLAAAPPGDLRGSTNVHAPGVGAHQIHLADAATHAQIACAECHVVPGRTDSPGHADSALPAEITFGALARTGSVSPTYDPLTRVCSNSYCHAAAGAVWTEPRTSDAACGSCHGLPPPRPHPQSTNCSSCHGAVVDSERRFVAPELHVDGRVELAPGTCTDCHGGGGEPAPPRDVSGNTDVTAVGVGAHRTHLAGGSSARALACTECHVVPATVDESTHADGLPAEVSFAPGVATAQGRAPEWSRASLSCTNTWCHGPEPVTAAAPPRWTDPTPLGCTSCHGAPPSAPHPQIDDCSLCHGAVVAADDRTFVDRARHVDGTVDVSVPASCTACHGGSIDAAPVPGTPGAGAHRAHLDGSARAAAVPCAACHVIPGAVLAPGHLDTPRPAEVTFSGAALAFGATPAYSPTSATCAGTPCHGGRFPDGNSSGGTNTTPNWTRVDGTQATCGSCHAIPPPRPHLPIEFAADCSACHQDIAPDNQTFVRPDLHADGTVTFAVP